jgi:protein SCO1/2
MGTTMRLGLTIPLVLLGSLAAGQPAGAHSLKDLEAQLFKREQYVEFVNRPAPEFELRDAEGKAVRLADFRGKKVVVLWFIYASCPDVCPLQSDRLSEVQKTVNKVNIGLMRDLVQFIAITTDPARDNPEVLRAYGPAHGLDSHNWVFLTSGAEKADATREIADRYGLKFTHTDKDMFMHGTVTHIIDFEGRLRARFHGLKWDQINMVVYINALTNDRH